VNETSRFGANIQNYFGFMCIFMSKLSFNFYFCGGLTKTYQSICEVSAIKFCMYFFLPIKAPLISCMFEQNNLGFLNMENVWRILMKKKILVGAS